MRLGNELAVDLYRYIRRCPRRMDGRRHKQGGQKLAGYRPLDADRLIRTDVAPTYRQRRIIRITQITDIGTQNKQRIDQVAYGPLVRSEEHTSELQSLMRISYAVFCLKKKNNNNN